MVLTRYDNKLIIALNKIITAQSAETDDHLYNLKEAHEKRISDISLSSSGQYLIFFDTSPKTPTYETRTYKWMIEDGSLMEKYEDVADRDRVVAMCLQFSSFQTKNDLFIAMSKQRFSNASEFNVTF